MRHVARVTEYLGREGGGFYIEAPDIPEGLTCAQWRRQRTAIRAAALEDSAPARPKPNRPPRAVLRWRPVPRPAA